MKSGQTTPNSKQKAVSFTNKTISTKITHSFDGYDYITMIKPISKKNKKGLLDILSIMYEHVDGNFRQIDDSVLSTLADKFDLSEYDRHNIASCLKFKVENHKK
jgi:hypothetical protein